MIGKEIGNHRILKELGKGGMGVVYKAHQLSLGRPVAMKVLPQHLTNDESFIKRFHNEARAIARLNHPNIVQIYDIGNEGDIHYYTMEFIEGPTLDDVIYKEGFLSPDRTLAILNQVAKALRYAHSQGIVHRDIKPSNIMIAKLGRVKLTDFGLALQQRTTRLTVDGGIVGTPEYMSPEQAAGRTATAQSDIYSLGVVAYELLTGKVPFEGDSPLIVLSKIQNTEPQWPRSIDPDIPVDLENIVRKMMARNPSERYASCQEIIHDTQNMQSGEPVSLQIDRSPSLWRIGAGVAVLAIVALGFVFALRRPHPPDKASKNNQGTGEVSTGEKATVHPNVVPGERPGALKPLEIGAKEDGNKEVALSSLAPPSAIVPEKPAAIREPEPPLRLETPGEIMQALAMLEDEFKNLSHQLNWQDAELVRTSFDASEQKLRLVESRMKGLEYSMYPDLLVIKQGKKNSEIRGRIVGETLFEVQIDTVNVDRQPIPRDKIEATRYALLEEARSADELLRIRERVDEIKKGDMSRIDNILNPRRKGRPVEPDEEPDEDTLEQTGEDDVEAPEEVPAASDDNKTDRKEAPPSQDEVPSELPVDKPDTWNFDYADETY
jgi:serine/threonine protein kinase